MTAWLDVWVNIQRTERDDRSLWRVEPLDEKLRPAVHAEQPLTVLRRRVRTQVLLTVNPQLFRWNERVG